MNPGDGMDVQPSVLHAGETRQPETYGLQHRCLESRPVVGKRNHVELADFYISTVAVSVFQPHVKILRLTNRVQGSAIKNLCYAKRDVTIRSDVFVGGGHIEEQFRSQRVPASDETVRVLEERIVESATELAKGKLAKRA